MSRASSLYRLQAIDLELDQVASRHAEIELLLSDSAEIAACRAELAEAEAQHAEARSLFASDDHAVTIQRVKIEQTDEKLYGGTISNPKELQDLQLESEALRRHMETLEERLLESLVALEDAESLRQQAADALESAQIGARRLHAALEQEQAELDANREKLETERELAVINVAGDDYQLYSELRSSMGSLVVAKVSVESCGVCGVTLSSAHKQEARSQSALSRCTQCNRLLYAL